MGGCTGGQDEPAAQGSRTTATGSQPTLTATATPREDESATAGGGDEQAGGQASTVTVTDETEEPDAEETGSSDLPPAAEEPQSAEPAGGRLLATGIRTGRHEGYDRVVLDLEGSGEPGYDAGYVDEAHSAGSGEVIEVAGERILRVRVQGLRYPDEGEQPGPAAGRVEVGGEYVQDAYWDAVFEGQAVLYLGVPEGEHPYRVFTLSDPARLVVDVE